MTVTIAQLETILVKRAGDLLTQAGLDGTTHDGTNADLADPVAFAVRTMGGTTTDPTNPADADLVALGVTDDTLDELLALAELRILETCHSALIDLVDVTIGPRREALGAIAARLEAKITKMETRIAKLYGYGLGTLETGVLPLDFVQEFDT